MRSRVKHRIGAALLDQDGEIDDTYDTEWRYDRPTPHHVTVEFEPGTVWKFPRSVLADGVVRPAGHGDVRFTPADGMVRLTLNGDNGQATLACYAVDLCEFLDDAFALVPEGDEPVDVDAGIALLLSPTFRSAVR